MRKLTIVSALFAALLAAAPFTPSAHAASQGTLGATSSGSIDIDLIIPNLAQISGLDDLSTTWTGGNVAMTENFCVFSTTRSYTIQADSANGTGTDFRLHNGGNYIVYDVDWTDTAPVTVNLNHGSPSATLASSATSATCGGGTNTSLTVNIVGTAISAVPAATYTDTLTLLVTPQ
jgi:spore coat protein U-like protein